MAGQVCRASDRGPARRAAHPEMVERRRAGGWETLAGGGGNAAGWQCLAAPGEYLSPLCLRPVGPSLASEASPWRRDRGEVRRRHRAGIPGEVGCRTVLGGTDRAISEVRARTASREDAPAGIRTVRGREPEAARRREAGDVQLPRLHAHLREEEEQRMFTVVRQTIRKRLQAKLSAVK